MHYLSFLSGQIILSINISVGIGTCISWLQFEARCCIGVFSVVVKLLFSTQYSMTDDSCDKTQDLSNVDQILLFNTTLEKALEGHSNGRV